MKTKTIHIAAPSVTINGRTIQRCAVCGLKLIDSLHEVAMNENGTPAPVHTWNLWDMIEMETVDDHTTRTMLVSQNTGGVEQRYPSNGCLPLVEL